MLTACAGFSIQGVGSPSVIVSNLAKMAVDDICGADLKRAKTEDVKKNHNCHDITNTDWACLLFEQTYWLMVWNSSSLMVCVFAFIAVHEMNGVNLQRAKQMQKN